MNDETKKAFDAWFDVAYPASTYGRRASYLATGAMDLMRAAWQAATLTERERCAGVCDKIMADNHYTPAFVCADAIRRSDA